LKLHVSLSNSKIHCPSVSLPPIVTCPRSVECSQYCYAKVFFDMYPSTRIAWTENWQLWQDDPKAFKTQLWSWLHHHGKLHFRWHVGGDIPSLDYLRMMYDTALNFPNMRFLTYTKTSHRSYVSNLRIIYSHQLDAKPSDMDIERPNFMVLRLAEPQPFFATKACPGDCVKCSYYCWEASDGDIITNHLHGTYAKRFSHERQDCIEGVKS
jgi:Gene product 88